eukprot:351306-Chlamydomonas_euryale.AAC.2
MWRSSNAQRAGCGVGRGYMVCWSWSWVQGPVSGLGFRVWAAADPAFMMQVRVSKVEDSGASIWHSGLWGQHLAFRTQGPASGIQDSGASIWHSKCRCGRPHSRVQAPVSGNQDAGADVHIQKNAVTRVQHAGLPSCTGATAQAGTSAV